MNQENLKLWLDALRSGKYNQTKHGLTKTDEETGQVSHCCLGVLCEVAIENGVEVEKSGADIDSEWTSYDGEILMPPKAVNEWIGVTNAAGFEVLSNTANSFVKPHNENLDDLIGEVGLAGLNDEFRFDFEQIADVIEAEYVETVPTV